MRKKAAREIAGASEEDSLAGEEGEFLAERGGYRRRERRGVEGGDSIVSRSRELWDREDSWSLGEGC